MVEAPFNPAAESVHIEERGGIRSEPPYKPWVSFFVYYSLMLRRSHLVDIVNEQALLYSALLHFNLSGNVTVERLHSSGCIQAPHILQAESPSGHSKFTLKTANSNPQFCL